MSNILSLIVSVSYILLVLGCSALIARHQGNRSEFSRKFVHIMVGNWVFITPWFTSLWAVALVPAAFVIINALSIRFAFFTSMAREHEDYGTVYYALSMLLLSSAAFALGWRELSFIGLLTMAYGDGFAALVGKRWGKHHPFSFAPDKTLEGSITVAASAFIVTLACVMVFPELRAQYEPWLTMGVIPALVAVLAAFVELTAGHGCDNLSLPISTGIGASLLLRYSSVGLYVYLLLALSILLIAYGRKAITEDGIVAAILTAATLYTFANVWIGISLLLFFVAGSVVSAISNDAKRAGERRQISGSARNWKQVICNSLPASAALWIAQFSTEKNVALLICFCVFAAACADTFSSEIGMLGGGRVLSLTTLRPTPHGTSGGVSLLGLAAGLLGSALLAVPSIVQFGFKGFVFVCLLGMCGTLIDSILGSSIQQRFKDRKGQLMDVPAYARQQVSAGIAHIGNSAVNLLSLCAVCILAYAASGVIIP
ncbi:MAG: DUF92 domain-containing protein [Bifidobacterium crudilactis]|jgi:uncharacterized protein (TIGR00297 family)|uniref:DUF92 domain-containing protein n=1 Tax=Bifidobacterium crudilactis TaxID=327277 RepID=UPI003A5BF074